MKIGIDACTWGNRRGFGRFTRELLSALLDCDEKNEYVLFIDREAAKNLKEKPGRGAIVVVDTEVSPMSAASASGSRSLRDLWAMTREVRRHKIDLFYFPAVYSYFPILNRTKIIVTIHDVIADHHPELIFPDLKSKLFWKLKQNTAIRQADLILTVSDYSKCEIVDYFQLPEAKVRVISEAARSVFTVITETDEISKTLSHYGISTDQDFLLYVGGISPHKNLQALAEAFRQLISEARFSKLKLVLVGDYKDDPFFSAYPALKKQIDEGGLADKVIFTGYIEDSELSHFYNRAALVVLPSLEEGFGLPAVEAMACGAPVAASSRGSLPEILGAAGRFFDPLNTKQMSEVIGQILIDKELRKDMSRTGLLRAREFLWKKAAQELAAIFQELNKT